MAETLREAVERLRQYVKHTWWCFCDGGPHDDYDSVDHEMACDYPKMIEALSALEAANETEGEQC